MKSLTGKFVAVDKPSSQWKSEYSTGLSDIDEQHRYFFFLIKAMDRSSKAYSVVPVRELLDELDRYSRYHFGCEELLMEVYGYSERESHAARHAAIRAQLAEFRQAAPIDLAKLRMMLYRWFVTHTTLDDRDFADHVRQIREPLMAQCGRGLRPANP